MRALANTHRVEIGQRLLDGGFDAPGETRLDRRIGFGRPFADGDGLRQSQQIARA